MAEATLEAIPRRIRSQPGWLFSILVRPRKSLQEIAAQPRSVWWTPIFVLTLASFVNVGVTGWLRRAEVLSGGIQLPPNFDYYPPGQQEQYLQAVETASGPMFMYVFPGLTRFGQVLTGWLLVSGLVHLSLTLLGGRGSAAAMVNLVAWSGLPYALRDLVRASAMYANRQLIQSPGLAGFAPAGQEGFGLYLAQLLALIDLYLIWHLGLLLISARLASGLSLGKARAGVAVTMLVILALQALVGYGIASLGDLSITRPFF